jgi:oligopeptide transport system substrate-binding protein
LAWAGLGLLVGCRPEPRADLVIYNGNEPETIDPHLLTGQPDGRIAAAFFEGLTRFNPTNARATPGLAADWQISPDGCVYTFHLRTNLTWSTGEPITAEDFVWSWQRAIDPKTGADYAGQLFYVKNGEAINTNGISDVRQLGIRAVDPLTVEVQLHHPTPFFLDLAASRIFCVVPRRHLEKFGKNWMQVNPLPCSGAYEFVDWRVNDRIRIRKNPRYWDAAQVELKTIDIRSGDNPAAALNVYLTGGVDVIVDKTAMPTELLPQLLKRPDFHRFPYLGTYFLRFNCTRPPFQDVRVRQAFCLVLDKQRITDRITGAGEAPTDTLTPPGTGGYQPPPGLHRDVARAKRLLAEAGYPGGRGFPAIEYMYNVGTRMHEQIAIEMKATLAQELGVTLQLRPLEWGPYLEDMAHLNYDLIRGSWIGDYEYPNTFLDLFTRNNGNNRTGWGSDEYDRLMAEANASLDESERFRLLRQAEALLIQQEVPILCVYHYVGVFAFDPTQWTGIFPNATDEHPFYSMRRVSPRTDRAALPRPHFPLEPEDISPFAGPLKR